MPELNVELARTVLDHVKMDPEHHSQFSYGADYPICGTVMCIAGWAVHYAGCRLEWVDGILYGADGDTVFDKAKQVLGMTYDQASDIFVDFHNESAIRKFEGLIKDAENSASASE